MDWTIVTRGSFVAGWALLAALLLAACNAGPNEALTQALTQAQSDLAAASARIAELETNLGELQERVGAAEEAPASVRQRFGEMADEAIADRVWRLVHEESYDLLWHYETGQPAGFYEGSEPHGAILQTFMNDIAFDAVGSSLDAFPPGAIFVKENYTPERVLDATTVMVKIDGYNPEAGDWFWAKYQPDGSLDAAGRPDGCIACHTQVSDNDFVYDATLDAGSTARRP